jgi:hypothetical protein
VCIGMTGSGKTGLGIGILEEAAIDGIPSLVIDPKGDMGNLQLTFPDLSAADFEPWIPEEEAAREGKTPAQVAAERAASWRRGLEEWGQDGERIRRLRDAAEVVIFTPGSSAGEPLAVLSSFDAPPPTLREDGDLLRERVATAAESLLGLLGIEADPVRSREHILLCNLLQRAWLQGEDLDLPTLIRQVREPPVRRVGVLEL